MKKIITLLLVATLTFPLSAQQQYTLDECLRRALDNNATLKNAALDREVAEQDRKGAFTRYFPSISATGGGFMANKGLIELPVMPGMEMSLMRDGIVGGVSANMPLFTGGRIVNGNRLAEVGVEVSRQQYRCSENEVVLTTEKYYWQVVMLKEKLNTIAAIDRLLASLHTDVEAAVAAGVATRNDLLQVQLRKNEMLSTRIEVENALSLSRNLLAQYIGLGDTDSIDVPALPEGVMPASPAAIYLSPESSLAQTPEYNLLQQNVKASRLQQKIAVGKNMPTIAIGGGYMYDNLTDKDHPFWLGFATVSVPLTDWWSGAHDIKKHKLQVRTAENKLNDNMELLVIRMKHAWSGLNDAYARVSIALQSIEQSKENLRLYTDYYEAGTCTMSDLLDAQTLYRRSCDQYIETYTEYEIKKREYLQATGR